MTISEDMLYYVCDKYQHNMDIGAVCVAFVVGLFVGVLFVLWRMRR